MRVVFMGTPEFAVAPLSALAGRHDVLAVYTQPDRPRGRGRRLTPSPVKELARQLELPVRQPETLKDPDVVSQLRQLQPDIVCVAAYGLIVPGEVLAVPTHGCVNVHASLLPRHRGAAPVHRAILEGDSVTGVVVMRMEEGLDTGPFTHAVRVPVDEHDVASLTAILAEKGATALVETLDEIEAGIVSWTDQNDADATYAHKVGAADVALEPAIEAETALRRVRASTPSARSRACVHGVPLEVLAAQHTDRQVASGRAYTDKHSLVLGFLDGALRLERVKPAGKAEMDAAAYARGAHIPPDAFWERCP
ncbi:MAG: methionyl-tRNA formyltransferase [Coriobacteriia bacterium]|nr:methionyl-tRNA formyltransferase [Coriobacteriia bacterium]